MDKFSEFHNSAKITFPKITSVILLWFLGLNFVAKFYATLPDILHKLPTGLNPTLAEQAMHLLTSIMLTGVGYVAIRIYGLIGIRHNYPRYYVFCHQQPGINNVDELIFGYFKITCTTDDIFTMHGDSYKWTGNTLERQAEWTSLAMTPNIDRNLTDVPPADRHNSAIGVCF